MKAYLVSVSEAEHTLELASALLNEGVKPEDLSIIVDESTQLLYLPVPGAGGRPTLPNTASRTPRGVAAREMCSPILPRRARSAA